MCCLSMSTEDLMGGVWQDGSEGTVFLICKLDAPNLIAGAQGGWRKGIPARSPDCTGVLCHAHTTPHKNNNMCF